MKIIKIIIIIVFFLAIAVNASFPVAKAPIPDNPSPKPVSPSKNKLNIEMIRIPAGTFVMGSNSKEYDEEKPAHKVYLDNYYISKYEITQAQYKKFVMETNHREPAYKWDPVNMPNYPVVGVAWNDANVFCKWVDVKIPTEAQWEKAARGGDRRPYPWGDAEPDCSLMNFNYCIGNLKPVGSYPSGKSPYGVYDMAGNADEWCRDWYAEDYYRRTPYKNPQGPDDGAEKIVRGGSWIIYERFIRCASRTFDTPSDRNEGIGFRIVIEK